MVKEMAQGITTGSIGEIKASLQSGKDSLAEVPVSDIVRRSLAVCALHNSIVSDLEALQAKVAALLEGSESLPGLAGLLTDGYVHVEAAQMRIEPATEGSNQPSADKLRGAVNHTSAQLGEAFDRTGEAVEDMTMVAERLESARLAVQNAGAPLGRVAEIARDLPSSLQTSQEAADDLAAFW